MNKLNRARSDQAKPRKRRGESQWKLAFRRLRRHRPAVISAFVLASLVIVALVAPWIEPYPPDAPNLEVMSGGPSAQHWLGTDSLGRDLLSRIIDASRISLSIGLLAVVVAVMVGSLIGGLSGFYGGWLDNILMRLVDVFLAVPPFMLLILITVAYGGGTMWAIILAIGLLSWMPVARLVRGSFLSLKEAEFVEAARSAGASSLRIILRHLFPNSLSPVIVAATLGVANAILVESALSFLGFGVQPPTATWGNILKEAFEDIHVSAWPTLFPGAMIFLTVIAINFLGDGLRDALDPRLGPSSAGPSGRSASSEG